MHNKKYKPKPVRIPIMRSTVDELASELHFGIMTAELGEFNEKSFQRIASVINLVSLALQGKVVDRSVEAAVDGAIRSMNEIDARACKTSINRASEFQIAAIIAGIRKIEEVLPTLTINDLRKAKVELDIHNVSQIQNTDKSV